MTIRLSTSINTSQFRQAISDLASLLSKSGQEVLPRFIDSAHVASQLGIVELDDLATPVAGELRFILKPSHRFLMLMAAARAGQVNFGVVEKIFGHNFSSVGGLEPTSEDRAPVESQGPAGACPGNSQRGN